MTYSTQWKSVDDPAALLTQPSGSQTNSSLKGVFAGRHGLRLGWRLLIFVVLVVSLLGGFVLIRNGGIQGFQEAQKHAAELTVTPWLMGYSEALAFLMICAATLIMGRIEHRKFSDYGLPLRQALGKDFWIGIGSGFLAMSGTLFVIFLLGGFRISGLALHGTAILSSMAGWGIAFIMVGLFEEFLCRGYAQFTLATGIGYWPAAILMSGLFGLGHAFNSGETAMGAVSAGLFGLLFCLFLKRTGNLWLPVGFHAAWDWSQTLFGVRDSGIAPYHNVFNSVFNGPRWLTGGTVGPEASVLTPIALLIVAMIFVLSYREDRVEIGTPEAVQGR
jgi:membrane protease YdiL (CAAX protease family)